MNVHVLNTNAKKTAHISIEVCHRYDKHFPSIDLNMLNKIAANDPHRHSTDSRGDHEMMNLFTFTLHFYRHKLEASQTNNNCDDIT